MVGGNVPLARDSTAHLACTHQAGSRADTSAVASRRATPSDGSLDGVRLEFEPENHCVTSWLPRKSGRQVRTISPGQVVRGSVVGLKDRVFPRV